MTFKDITEAYEYFMEYEYDEIKRERALTELLNGYSPLEAYECGRNVYDAAQLEDDACEYALNEWIGDNNIRITELEN